jgi:hypothetical protein
MRIKVSDPNGHEVLVIQFPLLDINIPRRRQAIIRSIGSKYGFLTGTIQRKDAEGIGYIEIMMKPEMEVKTVSLFARQIVKEFL